MTPNITLSYKTKRIIGNILKYLISIGIVCLVLGPILVILFASFKTKGDMVTSSPLLLPALSKITFDNYERVLGNKMLVSAFKNSFFIVLISVFFNVLLGSVTAYCLERFDFKFKKIIFALFIMGMMIPTFVTEIARFKIIQSLGLYNTLGAPIIIYIASDLMQIYIYRQFVAKIPASLDESALVDGCSYFRLFAQIIFPLLAPATATLIIIKSVTIINDMYIPYLYMPNNKLKTLTTFLMDFAGAQQGSWQRLSAAIVIVLIPTVLIYIFFQKYILEGISAGAVKE
ncbi:MAG: carbohydrate transporter permease [Clostridia bacterium]|jgi:multiple sugar transport system permease protein|nr:carbohydrate transporter permease [Clostridia bacterium]